jgi:hypothetical protein
MRGVAKTQLGGEPLLVDQAAEQITPADTIKIDDVADRGSTRPLAIFETHFISLNHAS